MWFVLADLIGCSSYSHKYMSIECITRMMSDAQVVVDLYTNYDCDENLSNVFKRIITNITKYAQTCDNVLILRRFDWLHVFTGTPWVRLRLTPWWSPLHRSQTSEYVK